MILDMLENAAKYAALHPDLAKAFGFLSQPGLAELPDGRHAIDGERIFAVVAHENGRRVEEALPEGHRKHIDVQFVVGGEESMGWAPRDGLALAGAYDAEKDLEFFEGAPASLVRVPPGGFAVFFPEDAHLPLVGEGPIHKVVVKIEV